jgi:hypothetical protein
MPNWNGRCRFEGALHGEAEIVGGCARAYTLANACTVEMQHACCALHDEIATAGEMESSKKTLREKRMFTHTRMNKDVHLVMLMSNVQRLFIHSRLFSQIGAGYFLIPLFHFWFGEAL